MPELTKTTESFTRRMRLLVEQAGSIAEFARRAGLSRQMIMKYQSGAEPNRESLIALARAGKVSLAWLATGEGSMTPQQRQEPSATGEPGEDYVALPRYEVQAAAGAGQLVETEQVVDWIHFRRDWLRRTLGVEPAHLSVIEAVGDSMTPTIDDGDLLLVDTGMPPLRGEGIYVLAVDDALIVKRVAIKPAGGLVISSDNSRYHATSLEISREELDRIRLVGRVVWVGSRL